MQQRESRSITYVCLETPRPGQAVYTHVHEIISGLEVGGCHVRLIATQAGGAASGGAYWRRGLGYIGAYIRAIQSLPRSDAVYLRAHFAALPIALICRLIRKPLVQEINGRPNDVFVTYPWLGWLSGLINASYRYQLRWADQIIAVTEGLRLWAKHESRHDRVSLIPNGANTTYFTPNGRVMEGMGYYVVFVGGLVAWHGVTTMLQAIDRPEWPENVKLVVVGDGVERDKISAAEGNVRLVWVGRKSYEEVPCYLRGALGALCVIEDPDGRSTTGVAPLKLFEAMACGLPVIVTELPFQADLVRRQGAGIVIPVANPEALASAVAHLLSDPAEARQMGLRGADYVRGYASWQSRADETRLILEHAICQAQAP